MRRTFALRCAPLLAVWLWVLSVVTAGPAGIPSEAPEGSSRMQAAARGCCPARARLACSACCCVEAPTSGTRVPQPASIPASPGRGDTPATPASIVLWTVPVPPATGIPSAPVARAAASVPAVPLFTRHCTFLI